MFSESTQAPAKSYRYLRIAMIALLVALAAAVFYQRSQQTSFLASVSAYYYTSAQGIFVGALIGLGASMIALQGMGDPENMFLNLGGIFAIVVAIVPTGRGSDFDTAVKACQNSGATLLTNRASPPPDCPTIRALQEASRANVENNVAALLIVGGLTLIVASILLAKGRSGAAGNAGRRWVIAGFWTAAALWLGGLIALAASVAWLAGHAHYIAASGLLVCIFGAVVSNAFRLHEQRGRTSAQKWLPGHRYTVIATVMVLALAILAPLWLLNVISLFWLEISAALMFILFWTTQTLEAGIWSPTAQ